MVKGDVIYTNWKLGDIMEGTVALPVLIDVEHRGYKDIGMFARDAEDAAALVAFQELEPVLMAKARARKAYSTDRVGCMSWRSTECAT